jgi:hypothetical protein
VLASSNQFNIGGQGWSPESSRMEPLMIGSYPCQQLFVQGGSGKHSSLLQYCNNYRRKKFYWTGPSFLVSLFVEVNSSPPLSNLFVTKLLNEGEEAKKDKNFITTTKRPSLFKMYAYRYNVISILFGSIIGEYLLTYCLSLSNCLSLCLPIYVKNSHVYNDNKMT